MNGRDFTQFPATLVPGAISRGMNSSLEAPAISVNGSRNSKTVFMVDGGSVSSQYFDVASVVPSVDAIQEFTVQSNAFAAENGQGTAIISASLKSGTNQLHGSAYEFLRNQLLDARNFFNTTGVRPPVKQNQFGFTLGGPVVLPPRSITARIAPLSSETSKARAFAAPSPSTLWCPRPPCVPATLPRSPAC